MPRKRSGSRNGSRSGSSNGSRTGHRDGESTRPRICFDRILPDDVDEERAVRRALREEMIEHADRPLDAEETQHVTRMALVNSKKWKPGSTLKCRFLDGSSRMKDHVESIAHEWEQHANIRLSFVTTGKADIRISFHADDGSWSALGRDALNSRYFPAHQPTMNYGWLRDHTNDGEYRRVVLHEFGHALSCVHEHQSPEFTRQWNKSAVVEAFTGPPNFWSAADIRHNVLGKYSKSGIKATRYDPDSIMLYAFDGALFSDGLGDTNSNTELSPTDIAMIGKMYR
jgi:hypothetical protein